MCEKLYERLSKVGSITTLSLPPLRASPQKATSIATMRDQQGSYTKINRLNIERFWTTRSALLPKSTRIRRGRQNDALKNGLFEAYQGLPPTAALRAVMAHAPAAPDGALRALGARCARVFCFLHKYRMCACFWK